MFYLQKVKAVLECYINDREKASSRLLAARSTGDELYIRYCMNRYQKIMYKVEGMEEMIYEMGYTVRETETGVQFLERFDID